MEGWKVQGACYDRHGVDSSEFVQEIEQAESRIEGTNSGCCVLFALTEVHCYFNSR